MKERRFVKLRTDMYEDTKFKIIDTKPERDTIHYIWTRLLTLAAKVNLLGDLFMSRNIPYTIETLAIEFNRSEEQIKIAIAVFLELEMIEIIDGRIYRVKNFAKHQNIKVEEKVKSEAKAEVNEKNIEAANDVVIANEIYDEEELYKAEEYKDKECKNNVGQDEASHSINHDKIKVDINDSGINKGNKLNSEISGDISNKNITIPFEKNKNKKSKAKKKHEEVFNLTDEEGEEDEMFCFRDGEYIPGEGEKIIASWTF